MAGNDLDALNRRKRIRPISTGKRLTPRDRDLLWFRKIHVHGPVSSSFLRVFSKALRTSEKRARERLTDLFNEDKAKGIKTEKTGTGGRQSVKSQEAA